MPKRERPKSDDRNKHQVPGPAVSFAEPDKPKLAGIIRFSTKENYSVDSVKNLAEKFKDLNIGK